MNLGIADIRKLISKECPAYLKDKRWFLRKRDEVENASFKDGWTVRSGEGEIILNSLIDVYYGGGGSDVYFLPLVLRRDGKGCFAAGGWSVCEPGPSVSYYGSMMESLRGAQKFETLSGGGAHVEFIPRSMRPRKIGKVTQFEGELSNTVVFLDNSEVVKIYRRLQEGVNPDAEVHLKLGEAGGSPVPELYGCVVYRDARGAEYILAIIEKYVKGAYDAWRYFQKRLGASLAAGDFGPAAGDASELGSTVAKLHFDLMRAFGSEEFGEGDARSWEKSLAAAVARVCAGAEKIDEAGWLAGCKGEITGLVGSLLKVKDRGRKIRLHGDLHLGQILKTPSGYCIIDFEGEPLKTPQENRKKNSPLKDVAGVLRSFNYASNFYAMEHKTGYTSGLALWEKVVSEAFLAAYLESANMFSCGFLPPGRKTLERMLALFKLEKALYEFEYEINGRPGWIKVPLSGIKSVLDEMRGLSD
jgi:trehalose synthase-fused probable maltokinase